MRFYFKYVHIKYYVEALSNGKLYYDKGNLWFMQNSADFSKKR